MKIYQGKAYGEVKNELFKADMLIAAAEEAPKFSWLGAKIPRAFIEQFFAFAVWASETHHCEVQARFYYSKSEKSFHMLLNPQNGGPASTNDQATPDLGVVGFPADCIPIGTIHSHPNMSAFQSGTDEANEKNQDGLHITIGWTGKKPQLHARVSYSKAFYNAVLSEWIQVPVELEAFSDNVKEAYFKDWVECLYPLEAPDKGFPEDWKKVIVPKVYTPALVGGGDWQNEWWNKKNRNFRAIEEKWNAGQSKLPTVQATDDDTAIWPFDEKALPCGLELEELGDILNELVGFGYGELKVQEVLDAVKEAEKDRDEDEDEERKLIEKELAEVEDARQARLDAAMGPDAVYPLGE